MKTFNPKSPYAIPLPIGFDVRLTPADRARLYNEAYPQFPAVWADKDWLMGMWVLGQNYQGSGYHGAYPPADLARVMSMFPDVATQRILHLFSGSLPPGPYVRLDRRRDAASGVVPDVCADAQATPFNRGDFDLILADPPYAQSDAAHYGVPMVNRQKVFSECARVLRPGGFLVWLDMMFPMHSKRDFTWWGAVGVVRSTNHRFRIVTFFERR